MLVAYGILPSLPVRNTVQAVKVRIAERYGAHDGLAQPPHVMFKRAFPVDDIEPYDRYLDRLVSQIEPFEIVVRGVAAFETPLVVYLDLVQDPRIKALQSTVLSDLAPYGVRPAPFEDDHPVPYQFHLTVAYGMSAEDHADLLRWLPEPPEMRFTVDRVAMFVYTGGDELNEWTSGHGVVYREAEVPDRAVRHSAQRPAVRPVPAAPPRRG